MEGTVLLVLSVSIVILSTLKSLLVTKPKHNLPPGPWRLPVIGNLHHLITGPNIQRAMCRLSQKHGEVLALQLGELPVMVVSSPQAAQEVMKTHDVAFSDWHESTSSSALSFGGNDVAFAPYGERWRQLRKICTIELLSAARVLSFRHIRQEEVSRFMENLAVSAGTCQERERR